MLHICNSMKRRRRTQKEIINPEEAAHEAYAVFVQGHRASRALPKGFLHDALRSREVYSHFLKLCLEYDRSDDLSTLREGLLILVKAIGVGQVATVAKVNRVTLYRMLSKGGNPGIKNMLSLLRALDMGFWVVDKEFYQHREQVRRRSGGYPVWLDIESVRKLRRKSK